MFWLNALHSLRLQAAKNENNNQATERSPFAQRKPLIEKVLGRDTKTNVL